MKRGVDVNVKNKTGETPLHRAIQNPSIRMLLVELLLKNANVEVNTENLDKNTPFHFFCSSFRNPNCEEVFNMFMKRFILDLFL
jgi:ankyrin repeat protein